MTLTVIPALSRNPESPGPNLGMECKGSWIPAFAGMTISRDSLFPSTLNNYAERRKVDCGLIVKIRDLLAWGGYFINVVLGIVF